jgi:dUTP pyrophosphatase
MSRDVFVKLEYNAKCPEKAYSSAAYDMFAYEDIVIPSQGIRLVSTGVSMDISPLAGVLTHRSGHNAKDGLYIYGLIDPDYRGIIKVNIMNMGILPFYVRKGQSIAQLRLVEVPEVRLWLTEKLKDTQRGENGFGSSSND